ncbi:MAG: hypothetical protein P8Z78_00550 [Gammaproteobacteria bacterium]
MSQDDSQTMKEDGRLFEPLSRPAHQPGMMLGIEAVRDEQAWNRRRLNRHQYWLHGAGTVVGLAVTLSHGTPDPDRDVDQNMKLIVNPGIALDGFGREVVLHEPYCLDLRAWIESRRDEETLEWQGSDTHVPVDGGLWLDITIRQRDCDHGLQPVIAHEVNATIDPVNTSRVAESVQLEIEPITPENSAAEALATPDEPLAPPPGAIHPGAPPDLENLLTQTERDYLDKLEGIPELMTQLNADRLYRLMESDLSPGDDITKSLDRLARIQLARIRLETLGSTGLVSHPSRVAINNLVRSFVTNPAMIEWVLHRHVSES